MDVGTFQRRLCPANASCGAVFPRRVCCSPVAICFSFRSACSGAALQFSGPIRRQGRGRRFSSMHGERCSSALDFFCLWQICGRCMVETPYLLCGHGQAHSHHAWRPFLQFHIARPRASPRHPTHRRGSRARQFALRRGGIILRKSGRLVSGPLSEFWQLVAGSGPRPAISWHRRAVESVRPHNESQRCPSFRSAGCHLTASACSIPALCSMPQSNHLRPA